jgi:uncharacterized protein YfaQ (DUF2300 family)
LSCGEAYLTMPNGEGANLAQLDGGELGLARFEHGKDVEAALARMSTRHVFTKLRQRQPRAPHCMHR